MSRPLSPARWLTQFAFAVSLLAGCSTLAGIKDDYHTAGDASLAGGNGGVGGGVAGSGGAATGGVSGDAGKDSGADADAGDSGGPPPKLGAKCASDADCNSIACITPTSSAFGNASSSGGPSLGYCTKICQDTPECEAVSPGAQCAQLGNGAKYCMLGCDPQAADNCRKRYDVICAPFDSGPDSGSGPDVCEPECITSNDCKGRICNLASGLCEDSQSTGLPVGSDCDPHATSDACQGFCMDGLGGGGTCASWCNSSSLGVSGACGSSTQPGSRQDAACLYTTNLSSGATVGLCGQLCDCDSDCRGTGKVCESWANAGVSNPSQFTSIFHQAGYCAAKDADAGVVAGIPSCPSDGGLN